MNYLDWLIVFLYITGIISFAIYLSRSQSNTQDYYLAGRKIKWWQSGASTMATQLSAISFVSAPAFVALKSGGGLKWLSYEFAVPLALILVMAIIIPVLHKNKYTSIYEYLEQRFDSGTRTLVSILFQLGRGLATAVAVLAGGIILSTAIGISTFNAILLIGLITLIYDVLGGIRVVIISDFMQMAIIVIGLFICAGTAWYLVGWETAWASLEPSRYEIMDFNGWGLTAESTYGFWPMLIGGFFLYASYYGTDQSQVQRELAVGNVNDVRKSLLVNAFGRFPLVLLYVIMGVLIGAVFMQPQSLEHVASILQVDPAAVQNILQNNPDRMVPMFILGYLPHGIIGFIFVAIMAALMSSLDSGLNSLSAVTMKDFYQKFIKAKANEKHYLTASKMITILWGVFCIGMAILLNKSTQAARQTTIVLINAVGSMLYGPILAAFLLGMLTKRINAAAIKTGIAAGIGGNLLLWIFTSISWMWWNVSGFLLTVLVAMVVNFVSENLFQKTSLKPGESTPVWPPDRPSLSRDGDKKWRMIYGLIILYFFIIIAVSWWLQG